MRVGTRIDKLGGTNNDEDHPHACGDKFRSLLLSFHCLGSSPCVWGQVSIRSNGAINSGIIPMRVGTRLWHGCAGTRW